MSIFLPVNKTDTMDNITISENIERLKEKAGVTQEELADRAGISRTSLQNILSAKVNLFNRHLPAIAEALGVSLEKLMLGYEPCDPDDGLLRSEVDHQTQLHELAEDYQKRLDELQRRFDLLEALSENQKQRIILLEQLNGREKKA